MVENYTKKKYAYLNNPIPVIGKHYSLFKATESVLYYNVD